MVVPGRRKASERVFYDSIFERMERDDEYPSALGNFACDSFQKFRKVFEFLVDLDAESLKDLGSRMDLPLLWPPSANLLHKLAKFDRLLDFFGFSSGYDFSGEQSSLSKLPVLSEHCCKLVL